MTSSSESTADALDLEFPDWSEMRASDHRLDLGVIFQLIEEYYPMLPKRKEWMAERWAEKSDVEFVL